MSSLNAGDAAYITQHVFLPKRIYHHLEDISTKRKDAVTFSIFSSTLQELQKNTNLPKLVEIVKTFHDWESIQCGESDSIEILMKLESLKNTHDFLPFFVRSQNALITFEVCGDEKLSVSASKVSPQNKETTDQLVDMVRHFPGPMFNIPASRVLNKSFAHQLAALDKTVFNEMLPSYTKKGENVSDIRDLPNTCYVTSWLFPTLIGTENEIITPRFETKMRDKVELESGKMPWRRSGLYNCAKLVLRYFLLKHFGREQGLFLYKLSMLQLFKNLLESRKALRDVDLGMQIISKISVRLEKLRILLNQSMDVSVELAAYVHDTFKRTCLTISKSKAKMNEQWEKIQLRCEMESNIDIVTTNLNFLEDTKMQLPKLTTEVEKWKTELSRQKPLSFDQIGLQRSTHSFPNLNCDSYILIEATQKLMDAEIFIRSVWDLDHLWATSTENVFSALKEYYNFASRVYACDPVRHSICVMTCYTFIAILDRVTARAYPLLLQYSPSVDLTCFDQLLLPQRSQMEHLKSIEDYFKNRENAAQKPGILENCRDANAIGVIFAASNSQMQHTKQMILEEARRNIVLKKNEVQLAYERYENLQSRIRSYGRCDQESYYDSYIERYTLQHSSSCGKCSLQEEANRISVAYYERPLPDNGNEQNAIVFEFHCPAEIGHLRDALHFFHLSFFKQIDTLSTHFKHTWFSYGPVSRYPTPMAQSFNISIGTTTSLTCHSRNSGGHPRNDPSGNNFIKPNGYNIHLVDRRSGYILGYKNESSLKHKCIVKAPGVYSKMQWAIDSSCHSDNEAICRQIDCPEKLSLKEFKVFCSARAGYNLQLRNILAAIVLDTLSFHQEGVVSLISQILWETGPNKEADHSFGRDSQFDLTNDAFIIEFTSVLEKVVTVIEENWDRNYVLLNWIHIAQRLLEFSETDATRNRIVDLLRQCRKTGLKWINKLNELSKIDHDNKDGGRNLRQKTVITGLIVCETFSSSPSFTQYLMTSSQDVVDWLHALSSANDNIILNSATSSVDSQTQYLIQRAWRVGLSIHDSVNRIIQSCSQTLTCFMNMYWLDSGSQRIGNWSNASDPWYEARSSKCCININVLTGSFLVNGNPISRLPEAITNNSLFSSFFKSKVFTVLPGSELETFVTSGRFSGSVFEFKILPENELRVVEIRENGRRFRLLPPTLLQGDLPVDMVNQYSHWWSQTKREPCLLFRSRTMYDKNFFKDICDYTIYPLFDSAAEVISWTLTENIDRVSLVNIASGTFKELFEKIFGRLESYYNIHMFFDQKKPKEVRAKFPRLGLSFICYSSGDVESFEFTGMQVCKKQTLGTLVGLQSGVLLEDIACSDLRKYIIPHGSLLENMDNNTNHSAISVSFADNSLKTPAFFVYGVNQRLQLLMAPSSYIAWLYLALLHMKTAYPIPDPFTGMTGNEMTCHILRSARSFSPNPLTDSGTHALEQILMCVAKRGFVLPHTRSIQITQWPEHPGYSTCCNETAYFLCNKLQEYSNKIAKVFPSVQPQQQSTDECHDFLTKKAYLQAESGLSPSALLTAMERITIMERSALKPQRLENSSHSNESVSMRILSSRRDDDQSRNLPVQPNLISLLISANHSSLPGVGHSKFISDANLLRWGDLDFAECWLDLFNFASNAQEAGDVEELHNLLTFMLYKQKVEMAHALALSLVSRNPKRFRAIPSLKYGSFHSTNEYSLKGSDIKSVFVSQPGALKITRRAYIDSKPRARYQSRYEHDERYGDEHQRQIESEANAISEFALRQWPSIDCLLVPTFRLWYPFHTSVIENLTFYHSSVITSYVSPLFCQRFLNLQLKQFIEKVEACFSIESRRVALPYLQEIEWRTNWSHVSCPNKRQHYDLSWNNVNVEHFDIKAIFNTGKIKAVNSSQETFLVDMTEISTPAEILPEENNCPKMNYTFNAFSIETDDPVAQSFFEKLQESLDAYSNMLSGDDPTIPPKKTLLTIKKDLSEHALALRQYVSQGFSCKSKDEVESCIEEACLKKRPVPVNFLPLILQCKINQDEQCVNLIGALAVIWTQEQRIERCLQHLERNKTVYLQREWANPGHTNWSPSEHPEWLLLELEQNWLIRPVQVDIALKMLNPPDNENTVMQLNMGEGKTSVIVPLLISSMSRMNDVIPQVITLSSLFPSNCNSLTDKLGGLLNLKLFTLPFRRHVKLSKANLRHTINLIRNDIMGKGFVVTVPEYLMSFHLKVIEHCRSKDDAAQEFMELQKLLDSNVRSILDESDEILHVKRQLVYTLGSQVDVGGKSQRWIVTQQLLFCVKTHLIKLQSEFGDNHVLLKISENADSHHFPVEFRLASADRAIYSRLCELICDDLFAGKINIDLPPMNSSQKLQARKFLMSEEISSEQLMLFKSNCELEDIIIIIRGLLAFKVLQHCFSLRYKVNYGVGPHRQMAVPFRAKDVAAEKTEFGHADVALVLTQLTYYYQGLSDEALNDVFQKLMQLEVAYAESLYSDWVSQCNPDSVHKSLKKLSGVNLSDMEQKHQLLFPLFCKHMDTINFWLANFVYPKECKQFQHKLVSNGWDLCPNLSNPVTGFSGTNDTQQLLPPTIKQCDLPELLSTNGSVIANLLRPENQEYERIPIGMEAEDVLRKLSTSFPDARVILDVGALIIQMNNRQVANALLDLAPTHSVHAAIYFDTKDQMVVVDRKKRVQNFHLSPFSEKLDKVITYLDEIHTRGTDLQFPSGTKAVVTLGKGLQKDRLVQACMRMRLLGKGHSVSFFATDEVHRSICDVSGDVTEPDTMAVLKWTMANSVKQIQDGLINWSHQGLCRLQKNLAQQKLQISNSLVNFGDDSTFRETLDLIEMYASERKRERHHVIIQSLISHIRDRFSVTEQRDLSDVIVLKCQKLIPERLSFCSILDEEQERELEQEQEEELEIVRPPKQDHKKPEVPFCVKTLVKNGTISQGFKGLYTALENTQIWVHQLKTSIERVYISPEFSKVVQQNRKTAEDGLDEFLRDPFWVMMHNKTKQTYLITPHEANELFREINSSPHVTLFMFTPVIHKTQIMVLHEAASLSLPPGRKLTFVEEEARLFGELHVFAGNLFFRTPLHEQMYCWYLGLVPQPRSVKEEAAFEAGYIEPRGFVKTEHRSRVDLNPKHCPFEESPIDLATSLIALRGHEDIMLSSHAYMILFRARRKLTET